VTDQFPTLEAAAALGFVILLWRTVLLHRDLRAVDQLHEQLLELLGAGQLDRALRRCGKTAGSTYARVARRILLAAAASPSQRATEPLLAALQHAAGTERAALRRRLGSGWGRDLVVLAVWLGAVLYGMRTGLGVWFVSMSAGGALLTVFGALVRHRVASRIGERALVLLEPTVRAVATRPQHADANGGPAPGATEAQACPECGARHLVAVRTDEGWGVLARSGGDRRKPEIATRFESLRVCPQCGYVEGRVQDPSELLSPSAHDRRVMT
jgi:hypothetical protein